MGHHILPNQPVHGGFYYAYVMVDIYSRYIIRARVFEADNAASMKAAKTQGMLTHHGVKFSHRQPPASEQR